jgi:hypothetical protein
MTIHRPELDTLKRITRAKYFLDHARIHSNVNSEFDSMLALHHTDNAMEILLRIIIRHLDIENQLNKSTENMSMDSLIALIDEFAKSQGLPFVPFKTELKHLRQLRNHVQHAGVLPISEIHEQLGIAFRAFDRCLQRYFDISIADVRYSTVVQNQALKAIVEEIENALDAAKYLESVVASRNAFEYAKIFILEYSNRTPEKLPLLLVKGEYVECLVEYVSELEERQTLNSYGIDLYLFDKFKDYLRHIPSEYCAETLGGYTVMQREWNKSDADFCYGFVIETINKWQTMKINPLYEVEPPTILGVPIEPIKHYFNVNDKIIYSIEELEQYSCVYCYSPNHGMRMFVGETEAEIFRNEVSVGNEYETAHGRIILDNISVNIASNFIPAWEVCV